MDLKHVLDFRPTTQEYVKKLYGLNDPGKMGQSVENLEQWIKKQNYFTQTDFDKRYLERAIINTKGSVEKAKNKFESICIMRTLLPHYFTFTDIRKDFDDVIKTQCPGIFMPNLTPEHYRVVYFRLNDYDRFADLSFLDTYKFLNSIMYEYLKLHDYCAGYLVICDFRHVSITNVLSKIKPSEFKNFTSIVMNANGMRIKNLIYVTPSKTIDMLVKVVKPLMTEKISKRITVCKDTGALQKIISKEYLPEELDGMGRSYKLILDNWLATLDDQETSKHLMEIQHARVDEKYKKLRTAAEFTELAGSFVTLSVD